MNKTVYNNESCPSIAHDNLPGYDKMIAQGFRMFLSDSFLPVMVQKH